MGVVLGGWQLQNMSSRWGAGAGMRLLAEEALEDGTCRAIGHKMSFLTADLVGGGSGSHGCSGWRGGFMGSDLFVCVFQILQDPDLLLH